MGKLQTKKMKKARFKRRFLTKSQARRMLQVGHKLFKRLCILKGIYPRQPPQFRNSMGKDKIYYITKDIRYIATDPILEKLREYDAFQKKLRSLSGQGKRDEIARMQVQKPWFRLDQTIRERYPTFQDALRDLSDALSMVALYSLIPARVHSTSTIEGHQYHTTGLHTQCIEIMKRWKGYIESQPGALEKGFLSIKGFYYQARVYGEEAMWLVPHEFANKFPKTVEHSVMMSFLEFHVNFLQFVLYKLEHDAREGVRRESGEEEDVDALVPVELDQEQAADKKTPKGAAHAAVSLPFKGLVVYTSREAVPEHMNFLVKCMGGVVAYTLSTPGITHYVIDRPCLPIGEKKLESVEYVQPQYLFDCLNARVLLPVDGYGMGCKCPPHVSPFVVSIRNNVDEFSLEQRVEHRNAFQTYVPERVHELRQAIDPKYEKGSLDALGGKRVRDDDDNSSIASDEYNELVAGTKRDPQHLNANITLQEDSSEEAGSSSSSDDEEEGLEVHEDYVRSKESAKAVEKMRRQNIHNAPTAPEVAEARRKVIKENLDARVSASAEEKGKLKQQLKRQREDERREGAKALLSKKVRGVYVAASISKKRLERKSEHLSTKEEEIKKGKLKVNPKHGYLEKAGGSQKN